jgi:hypothetical protein
MPSNIIAFESSGLYILVSDIGDELHFHWGLYLAKTASEGQIFHLIRGPHTDDAWTYQTKPTTKNAIPHSVTLLVAMRIGFIEEMLQERLEERLAQLYDGEMKNELSTGENVTQMSCRVWIKAALHMLDQEGFIAVTGTMEELEMEAWSKAVDNKARDRRTVIQSVSRKD